MGILTIGVKLRKIEVCQVGSDNIYYRHLVKMPSRIVKVNNDALPPVIYTGVTPDGLAMLLADKRSESTQPHPRNPRF